MAPLPRGSMCRSAALVQRNVPFSVTSSTRSHCSSVISASGVSPPRPALFTATSIRPYSAATVSNSRRTSCSAVTSQTIASGFSPAMSARSSAASPSRRSCRSLIATRAPSSAQRRAVANPIPVPAAAVTTTVFPASRPWLGCGCGALKNPQAGPGGGRGGPGGRCEGYRRGDGGGGGGEGGLQELGGVPERPGEPGQRAARHQQVGQLGAEHPLRYAVEHGGDHGVCHAAAEVLLLHVPGYGALPGEQEPGAHRDARGAVGERGDEAAAVAEAACAEDRDAHRPGDLGQQDRGGDAPGVPAALAALRDDRACAERGDLLRVPPGPDRRHDDQAGLGQLADDRLGGGETERG